MEIHYGKSLLVNGKTRFSHCLRVAYCAYQEMDNYQRHLSDLSS